MTYGQAIEYMDYGRIDKLNKLHNKETFWRDVRSLTKRIMSDHAISRWLCLAEYRFEEL